MDPFTMAGLVLGKLELTSDQLAQLRAINTKYFTEVAALQRRASADAAIVPAGNRPATRDMTALNAAIAADIRELLTAEQQVVFDRNFPRVWAKEIEGRGEADRDALL